MSKSKRIVGPFTSEFGTFQPGDKAIAVTMCTSRTNVARVEYVGYVEREDYNWNTKKSETMKFAQIRRTTLRTEWYDKDTNEKCNWRSGKNMGVRHVPATIITTLQYNRLIPDTATTDELMQAI
jgi:hypothetical protein